LIYVLAIGLPVLTVVFAVVMAGFLLAESIADAVAVHWLRNVGTIVLLVLVADALTLACVLGLQSSGDAPPSVELGQPPAPASQPSRPPSR
jgi:hypothetical protein